MTDWLNRCHFGDVRDVLKRMVADGVKVQTIVCSPPYWGLRSYLPADHPDKAREIGSEPTLGEFLQTMVGVFDLCREVLADDGTMWMNMGDSYASGGRASYDATSTNRGNAGAVGIDRPRCEGFKAKNLMGQPWRLAFALQDAGWYLRQDIIWHKPNPMPESIKDRCTKAHEYIFLMSKSERYYFDQGAIRTPLSAETKALSFDTMDFKARDKYKMPDGWNTGPGGHGQKPQHRPNRDEVHYANSANKRSVWTVATEAYPGSHFATFPTKLIEPCILAGAPAGGVVLDPFFGSGTTGQVAQALGRKFIGCELNEAYKPLQDERLRQPSLDLEAA